MYTDTLTHTYTGRQTCPHTPGRSCIIPQIVPTRSHHDASRRASTDSHQCIPTAGRDRWVSEMTCMQRVTQVSVTSWDVRHTSSRWFGIPSSSPPSKPSAGESRFRVTSALHHFCRDMVSMLQGVRRSLCVCALVLHLYQCESNKWRTKDRKPAEVSYQQEHSRFRLYGVVSHELLFGFTWWIEKPSHVQVWLLNANWGLEIVIKLPVHWRHYSN